MFTTGRIGSQPYQPRAPDVHLRPCMGQNRKPQQATQGYTDGDNPLDGRSAHFSDATCDPAALAMPCHPACTARIFRPKLAAPKSSGTTVNCAISLCRLRFANARYSTFLPMLSTSSSLSPSTKPRSRPRTERLFRLSPSPGTEVIFDPERLETQADWQRAGKIGFEAPTDFAPPKPYERRYLDLTVDSNRRVSIDLRHTRMEFTEVGPLGGPSAW